MHTIARISICTLLSLSALLPAPARAAQDPSTMSDADKLARAKTLFGEGNAAMDAGDFATAVARFEEAYNVYAPARHVFNFNIGNAAMSAGDCVKARQAFQRFLDLVPDHAERGNAQEKILEIDRSGCAQQQAAAATPTPAPQPQVATPVESDSEDAPVLQSKRSEREAASEQEREDVASKKASGLTIGGALLTGLGVAGLGVGVAGLVIANGRAKDLAAAASPGPTGFPPGDYSTDDVYALDRTKLKQANMMGIVGLAAGGALLVTGVVLLVVDGVRKKKAAASGSAARPRLHVAGVGPALAPGFAGGAASFRF
jgi:tetratricopeptide (TPR) repeat protein